MKVILTENVKALGKKDQVVEVAEGYARNFLIPKKLAIVADAKATNDLKGKESSRIYREEEERKAAKALAEKLAAITLKMKSSAGVDGKLYGAVTTKDIAEAMQAEYAITLDKRKLSLAELIKHHGTYTVDAKLHTEVSAKFTVVVHA